MSFDKISEELGGEYEKDENSTELVLTEDELEDENLEDEEGDSDQTFVKKGFKRLWLHLQRMS